MSIGSLGLAFLAGILSILSPCVLPLLPIVLGTAASERRWGPVALAGGVSLSFIAIGLFVATIGFGFGVDAGWFRVIAAFAMILIGTILLLPALQLRVAVVGGPVSDWVDQSFGGFSKSGLGGQFGVGLLLGAVWSPCGTHPWRSVSSCGSREKSRRRGFDDADFRYRRGATAGAVWVDVPPALTALAWRYVGCQQRNETGPWVVSGRNWAAGGDWSRQIIRGRTR
jgi:hypothetical protein